MTILYIVHDPSGQVISAADVANLTLLGANVLTLNVDEDVPPRQLYVAIRNKLAEMLLGRSAAAF